MERLGPWYLTELPLETLHSLFVPGDEARTQLVRTAFDQYVIYKCPDPGGRMDATPGWWDSKRRGRGRGVAQDAAILAIDGSWLVA